MNLLNLYNFYKPVMFTKQLWNLCQRGTSKSVRKLNNPSILRFSLFQTNKSLFSTKENKEQEAPRGKTTYEQRFGKNKRYEKPEFLGDDYDHLGANEDINEDEFLPEYFSKDAPEYKRNPKNINLPWLINGVPDMEIKTRFIGDQIFSRMKVHKGEVLEHLFKIYRATLLSAADGDYDFLREY